MKLEKSSFGNNIIIGSLMITYFFHGYIEETAVRRFLFGAELTGGMTSFI